MALTRSSSSRLSSCERERSSARRSSRVWWRLDSVEREVEGVKFWVRKSVRARGGAKGRVVRSSLEEEEEREERPEVVLGERVSEIWWCRC